MKRFILIGLCMAFVGIHTVNAQDNNRRNFEAEVAYGSHYLYNHSGGLFRMADETTHGNSYNLRLAYRLSDLTSIGLVAGLQYSNLASFENSATHYRIGLDVREGKLLGGLWRPWVGISVGAQNFNTDYTFAGTDYTGSRWGLYAEAMLGVNMHVAQGVLFGVEYRIGQGSLLGDKLTLPTGMMDAQSSSWTGSALMINLGFDF